MLPLEAVRETNKPVVGPVGPLPPEVDVAVIGGGPVGLTVANLLATDGVRVLLIEQATHDAGIGKSALFAAQTGLSTTGHNISNANVAESATVTRVRRRLRSRTFMTIAISGRG